MADESETNEAVLRSLAASYNNLGSLQDVCAADSGCRRVSKGDRDPAQACEGRSNQSNLPGRLARTYNNLGFLSSRTKDWKKAELCYGDAIQIQENLVKASPMAGVYRRDLAISYNNLGMAQSRDGRLAEAEASFQKSAQLQDDVAGGSADGRGNAQQSGQRVEQPGHAVRSAAAICRRREGLPEGDRESAARALDAAPTNDRYRALLSRHYLNFARNLNKQAKYEAAVQAAIERKQLWPGNADRLYSVAQQLAGTYGLMRAASTPQQSQAELCDMRRLQTLREALRLVCRRTAQRSSRWRAGWQRRIPQVDRWTHEDD